MDSTWQQIEESLITLYDLDHNRAALAGNGTTPRDEAKRKLQEIRSGLSSASRESFVGPKLFLRVVGPGNRAYSGEWWFDAAVLDTLDAAHSRIFFSAADRKRALRDMLREALAVSSEWNPMTALWALELPPGQSLVGYSGPGTPQRLFANLPLTSEGNRMLAGRVRQIFFPVKNPLWVREYRDLSSPE